MENRHDSILELWNVNVVWSIWTALGSVWHSCLICLQVSQGGQVEGRRNTFLPPQTVTLKVINGCVGMVYMHVCMCLCMCVCLCQEVVRSTHTHTGWLCGGVKMRDWYLSNSMLTEERGKCVGESGQYNKLLTHTLTHTHKHAHTRAHTRIRTHTHARIRTNTRTHTYTSGIVCWSPGQQTKGFLLLSSESWWAVSCFQDFGTVLKTDNNISLFQSY